MRKAANAMLISGKRSIPVMTGLGRQVYG